MGLRVIVLRTPLALFLSTAPVFAGDILRCTNDANEIVDVELNKGWFGGWTIDFLFRGVQHAPMHLTTATSTHFTGIDKARLRTRFDLDRITGRLEWATYVIDKSVPALADRCDGKITISECVKRVRNEDSAECVLVDAKHPRCPYLRQGSPHIGTKTYTCAPAVPKF